mmetsp:Transcript_12447/g.29172  ORF Transcript_12447/g.29172 Transcript_12447/m.29172 type:complete len:172 (-) Transcript_12447:321-836(-)
MDQWPLFLMSSSQSSTDSMVGGLWTAWFDEVAACLSSPHRADETLHTLYCHVAAKYRRDNAYELLNAVKATCGVPKQFQNVWHVRLQELVTKGEDGSPDLEGIARLQNHLRSGAAFSRKVQVVGHYSGQEVDLAAVVKKACECIAQPQLGVGSQDIGKLVVKQLCTADPKL